MKKFIALLCALLMVFSLSACGKDEQTNTDVGNVNLDSTETTDSTTQTEETEVKLPSADDSLNGIGNKIFGGGFAVTDGEWIYYRSYSSESKYYSLKKMSMDGETVEYISEDNLPGGDLRYLNLEDGFLYGTYRNGSIWRLDIAGREEYEDRKAEQLNDYNSSDLTFVDGWLYYCTNDLDASPNGIYKMKPDGSENTLVYAYNDRVFTAMQFDGDWIYFEDTSGKDWRVKLDGTGAEELPSSICSFVVKNNSFYDRDGAHSDLNTVTSNDNIVILGDTLYFCNSGGIYKQNPDGSNQVLVIDTGACGMLHVLGDWLYFYDYDAENWYFCKTDGSGLKVAP